MGDDDFARRFGGVARLFGNAGLERLRAAHVCVIGVGGVGSWTVEALARSGVGALTMIDLDDVCVTNVNRQLPALDGQIGRAKVDVLTERVRLIHPGCARRGCWRLATRSSSTPRTGWRTSARSSRPAASARSRC
jgi:tRNA A37 threonylcarbamoyladenosine dehydratase